MRELITAACMATVCFACTDTLIREEFTFQDDTWISGDSKSIAINAPDTSKIYQLELRVDHLETYGFQNLYVRTHTTFPSGKEVISVTSLELANADATWAGDCSGDACSINLSLQSKFKFPEEGNYTWRIEPYMRIDTIKGIKSIAAIFREVKL